MPWALFTSAAAVSGIQGLLCMPCEEGCRTAVFGKTERTVGWEGNGEPVMRGLLRHCIRGNPQSTDRPYLPPLTHSFTLDFITTAHNEAFLKEVLIPEINAFLKPRGVALSQEKTRITHISQGFDFLGQTIRKFARKQGKSGKLQITPSRKSLQEIKAKVKHICKTSGQITQGQLIDRLNPTIRGWANYHRHSICTETFAKLDSYVWRRVYIWTRRRHPHKTGKWIKTRYFTAANGYRWTFKDEASGKALIHVAQKLPHQRHIKVKAQANPFAKEWEEYFHRRAKKLKMQSVNKFNSKVLRQQKGICLGCRQMIQADEEIDLHHKDENQDNNRIVNLELLHPNCHRQVHHAKDSRNVIPRLPKRRL